MILKNTKIENIKNFLQVPNKYSKLTVINGFWRSGTTWVLQILSNVMKSKSIFEPLHWKVSEYCKLLNTIDDLPLHDLSYYKLYMPSINDVYHNSLFIQYLDKAFKANIKEDWIRRGRTRRFHLFCNRFTVKLVRGHLLLPYISNEYQVRIFHVIRDPRAIMASIKRNNWGEFFKALSLNNQLLAPNDERRQFFEHYSNEIELIDSREDFVEKVTAYWALTELYVWYISQSTNITFIHYEKLVKEGSVYLENILEDDYNQTINPSLFKKHSVTTQIDRKDLSINQRIYGWKDELTEDEIKRINDISYKFNLQNWLQN